MYKILLAISLAAVPLIGASGVPVLAADASTGTPDCSKASAMMQNNMTPSTGVMSSGDPATSVDAVYLKSMKATLDQQNAMAKMEVACGTNATVKANAKEALVQMQSHIDEVIRIIRSIGG